MLVAVHVWGWQKAASGAAAQTLVLNLGQSDTIRFVRLSSFSVFFFFIHTERANVNVVVGDSGFCARESTVCGVECVVSGVRRYRYV